MNKTEARNIGLCKGVLRHAWYPATSNRTPVDSGNAYITNRCERCGRERWLLVDRPGNKIGNWRYHSDDEIGYKSVNAVSMAEWRLQYLRDIKALPRKSKGRAA